MTVRTNLPKFYIFFATLASLTLFYFVLVLPAFAQTTATTGATTRKEKVEQRLEKRAEAIETKKTNIQARIADKKERIATREATLKTKLAAFRDKAKATIAERINTNLNRINDKQTEMMGRHLDNLSGILTKLETRVNEGKPDIKDPDATRTAIANAKAHISSASAVVSAQADKDYTITVNSESTVKTDAKAMRDLFKTDIEAVRAQVISARQLVATAIRTAKGGTNGQ